MKKSTIIIIVVAIVAVLIIGTIGVVGGFFIVKSIINNKKEPITVTEFRAKMSQEGLNVQTEYSYEMGVISKRVAKDYNSNYKIEFYKLSDVANATILYNSRKQLIESTEGWVSSKTSTETKNVSKYAVTAGGKYMVVSRVGDTVIYVNADSKYKDKIKDILKAINY